MKSSGLIVSSSVATTPVLVGCATSPGHGGAAVRDPNYSVSVVFTDHGRRLINDYYAPRYKTKACLPVWPRRTGFRPDMHGEQSPNELEQRLTRLPPEYVRAIIGPDVVIMNVRTRVVAELLGDITD